MKKFSRFIIISICVTLIISSILTISVLSFLTIYSRKNIDSDYDERLFQLSVGTSYTEYYCNGNLNTDSDEYIPMPILSTSLGEKRKRWVSLSEASMYLKNGFIAVEDREFYSHSGVNLRRTCYAIINTVLKIKKSFGASTITQQVIKNISGDNEVTVKRKLKEIIRAYKIEKLHTKDEILEVYINIIPMGENIYGVGSASEVYFGKSPSELSLSEAAALVGITNAPTRYNPHINPDECKRKRDEVLYSMLDFGVINEEEYNCAVNDIMNIIPIENTEGEVHSWFIETVNEDVITALCEKNGLSRAAAEAMLIGGGLKIYTTEVPSVQEKLEAYFENTSNFSKKISNGLDYAMVILDSKSGDLAGIVGSVGKKSGDKLLNLALTNHTPGSVLKPIALYAPLINEGRISWSTVFDDTPVSFTKSGDVYNEFPKNYPNSYSGLINVKDALRLSKNTVAVRLYNILGQEKIYKSLKNDFGFDTIVRKTYSDDRVLSDLSPSPLALGQLTYGVSLRKLTDAYSTFPREGVFSPSRSFISVYDSNGNLILDNSTKDKRIFKPECARLMNKLLSTVTEDGTASKITLKNTVDTAGKTGTSGDDKDRLFIGYTPYYTAGIWCGYRNGGESIGKVYPTHIKIWDDIMKDIHNDVLSGLSDENIESFSDKGLVSRCFCYDSGKLSCESCKFDPRGERESVGYFIKGQTPSGICDRHILCYYNNLEDGIIDIVPSEDDILKISLLIVDERDFPKQIAVGDDDYVYRISDDNMLFERRKLSYGYFPSNKNRKEHRLKKRFKIF